MGKRIVIKTTLICIGIFLILNSLALAFIFKKYPLDMEKYVTVVITSSDIGPGTVIELRQVKTKLIQSGAFNSSMETEISNVVGKKASIGLSRDEYILSKDLIDKSNWFSDDERIIILPVSIEERLANLIVKGSFIDIRLKKASSPLVETVLSKVKVADMLDENGNPLDSKTGINSKTAYMELILGKEERQKIYSSITEGKLIYELYCDEAQKAN